MINEFTQQILKLEKECNTLNARLAHAEAENKRLRELSLAVVESKPQAEYIPDPQAKFYARQLTELWEQAIALQATDDAAAGDVKSNYPTRKRGGL